MIKIVLTLLALSCLISCAANPQISPSANNNSTNENGLIPPGYMPYPLLWEDKQIEGKQWSGFVNELIHQHTPELIQGAEDITLFCPLYYQLTTFERVNLWGLLVSGIVKYESGFDPTSRMRETTMGIDPVTGNQVYSEGLLQLSYQDVRNHPFCDEFDWDTDKNLPANDPRKTILNPYKNLSCGVKILAKQIRNKNRITVSSGVYWAVIRGDGKRNKIAQISALTKAMPGCM